MGRKGWQGKETKRAPRSLQRVAFRGIENEERLGYRGAGKGGRNKSSASNRGRASARFYSRTLNSIAIGFPTRSSYARLFLSPLRPRLTSPGIPLSFSSVIPAPILSQPSTPGHIVGRFLARENLIASDAIKHPGDERDRLSSDEP